MKTNEPRPYGETELNYNEYLKVPELLALQVPQSQPAHHDELLFIVIHQCYELWFKLVLHEVEQAIHFMEEGEVLRAHHFMKRVVKIFHVLVPQIHILETMTPADFLKFRDHLKPASGFQSLQFRELEFMAGLKDEKFFTFFKFDPEVLSALKARMTQTDLRTAYFTMLNKMGFACQTGASPEDKETQIQAVLPIYQDSFAHMNLYLLSESLIEFDEYLSLWREHHVRVVERIIGFKQGTGGSSGVEYLRQSTVKKCFPALWEVRTRLV